MIDVFLTALILNLFHCMKNEETGFRSPLIFFSILSISSYRHAS